MKRTQKQIDEEAIVNHKAVGADNPGGQDKIDRQRFVRGAQDDANNLPFNPPRKSIMGPIANHYRNSKEG